MTNLSCASLQKLLSGMCFWTFDKLWIFMAKEIQKKCSMLSTWDATYTTLYHVKHKNSCVYMLVWFLVVSLKIVVDFHPYSIWQAEDADRLYWAISQHWVVAVNTNEIAEKLINLHNIFVQIKKKRILNTLFHASWFDVNKGPTRCNSMQTFIHCHVTLHQSGSGQGGRK